MADVIIVGGGPAGMTAALFAKTQGARILLLEHNEKLGKKLYITGKGSCNVTNLCEREEFLSQVPRNPQFLYAALAFLSPQRLCDWLSSLGCPTVVERGRRVFPASRKASDVTRALAAGLKTNEVRYHARVQELFVTDGQIGGVRLENNEVIQAGAVVLATGGLSYPSTGSTGLGHAMAQLVGHAVSRPLLPSLTGFDTIDEWPKRLQGLTLKNVKLLASWGKRSRFEEQGEILFTHFGVSGPLVLSLSSYLAGQDLSGVQVAIDLKPALTHEVLQKRLEEEITDHGKRTLGRLLTDYLPASLAAVYPDVIGLPAGKVLNQLTRLERAGFVEGLKRLPVRLRAHRPFSEAVITCGGVMVSQVDSSTMASKLIAGLYFAGELLDVDALTGGYNLQIAFSTGALAGYSAASRITSQGMERT